MVVDGKLGARVLNGAARVAVVVVAGALATGCYAYNTPHLGESERLTGRQVQATLTDSGSVVLAAKVGPAVEQLRGSVVSEDLTSLSVAMDESVHRDGTGAPWRQEVVQVPRPLIREIDIRAFSPSRTLFAAFLTSAALLAVEKGFLKSGGANAPGTGQTGTPVAR
jgi:hypothetical protein